MKRIIVLHPAAKTPIKRIRGGPCRVDRVKIDCARLPIPFIYTGNWIRRGGASAADPLCVRGGQVSGIAGRGVRKIIRGVSGLVHKT